MSPEQASTVSRKTYTLCDMFSFGLIVKWLLVGAKEDVPFRDVSIGNIVLEHERLCRSGGSSVHPYVEDLSLVPPMFRQLVQFCTAIDASQRWSAPKAMRELSKLKSRVAAGGAPISMLSPPPAAVQHLLHMPVPALPLPAHVAPAPAADAAPAGPQPKPEIVAAVESMGLSNNAARKAALALINSSADAAAMWVMEHMDDPTLNDAPVVKLAPSGGGPAFSQEQYAAVEAMGFPREVSHLALKRANGNPERAAEWILSNM